MAILGRRTSSSAVMEKMAMVEVDKLQPAAEGSIDHLPNFPKPQFTPIDLNITRKDLATLRLGSLQINHYEYNNLSVQKSTFELHPIFFFSGRPLLIGR